ncbi:tropomyosin-like [Miscanthus floridulus]|uniref:tropomyosin-like n=1 Tax=Miscanthus floridulus TaxID=154761 RepID=UPI003459F485
MAEEQTSSPVGMLGVVGAAVRPRSPPVVPQATAEEDEVVEIECAALEPQSVRILRKRGEEVVVIEEENTTREIKRLKSAIVERSRFISFIVNPQGIARTADQRHQLIKRMEPLAEENKILQEALSLSEKSIQRAQHERDLEESNWRDLEHQNGFLSERLTASSEQLKKTSEELAIVSEELKKMFEQLSKKNGELDSKTEQLDRKCQQLEDISKLKSEQDAELNQLRQTIEQIRQEKTKESERADKLSEELKDY